MEMPELERFHRENKDQGLLLIGVDVNETPDEVRNFLLDHEVSFTAGIDGGAIQKLYGITAYPTTVMVGLDGKVLLYEIGAILDADTAFKPFFQNDLKRFKKKK
jgi:thiol-disulfide isomerase/thioredoxin